MVPFTAELIKQDYTGSCFSNFLRKLYIKIKQVA
ncbi:uncharacterized protein METZ01_LOCUS237841 [marine metagenome]|uniref:Uncharacterized protein n=1 Tax=marine metagenome TaxID=408172 RepID=A0A382HDJ4_9ZZZZ